MDPLTLSALAALALATAGDAKPRKTSSFYEVVSREEAEVGAEELASRRQDLGYSLEDLALRTGISPHRLSVLEQTGGASSEEAATLSAVMGIEPEKWGHSSYGAVPLEAAAELRQRIEALTLTIPEASLRSRIPESRLNHFLSGSLPTVHEAAILEQLLGIEHDKWRQSGSGIEAAIRNADSASAAKALVHKLYFNYGMRPPFTETSDYAEPAYRERIIQALRNYGRVVELDLTPRGSPLWRSAMKDVANNRMTRLESGLALQQGQAILQTGPSTQGAGNPHPENMPELSKAHRIAVRELRRRGYDAEDEHGTASTELKLIMAAIDKADQGLFAAQAGTIRTEDYAKRAAGREGVPVSLSFSLPRSLANATSGSEYRVPRSIFVRWARDLEIKVL